MEGRKGRGKETEKRGLSEGGDEEELHGKEYVAGIQGGGGPLPCRDMVNSAVNFDNLTEL